jgi:hypothetical protein
MLGLLAAIPPCGRSPLAASACAAPWPVMTIAADLPPLRLARALRVVAMVRCFGAPQTLGVAILAGAELSSSGLTVAAVSLF